MLVSVASIGCTWNTDPVPYRGRLASDVVADLLIDGYEVRFGDLSERCEDHPHNVVYVCRGQRVFLERVDGVEAISERKIRRILRFEEWREQRREMGTIPKSHHLELAGSHLNRK